MSLMIVTFMRPLIASVFAGRKTSLFGLYAVIHSYGPVYRPPIYRPVCFSCFRTLIGVRRRPERIEMRRTDGRGCFLLVVLTRNSFLYTYIYIKI